MRPRILFAIFILATCNSYCQMFSSKQNGGYSNYFAFEHIVPTYKYDFEIVKRSSSDGHAIIGNDYEIICKDTILDSKTIDKEIWGIFQDDTLYLNGRIVIGVKYFIKVELLGKYSFLRSAYPTKSKIKNELGISTPWSDPKYEYMHGALGVTIEGLRNGLPPTSPRVPLIFELQTNKRMLLTKLYLMQLLKVNEVLLKEYEAEPDNTREIILLNYLNKLNESLK